MEFLNNIETLMRDKLFLNNIEKLMRGKLLINQSISKQIALKDDRNC